MALQVRFLSTRPDTSAAFWWSSTESDIVNFCNTIIGFAQNLGIQHSYVEGEDQLSSVSTFTVESVLQWNNLSKQILENIPGMLARRKDYYTNNNHTLVLEWVDSSDNTVVFRNTKVLTTASAPTF